MQEVRLRQARRHRETLRAVQSKPAAILERPQESRRSSRWRPTGGNRWREDEEEIKRPFCRCWQNGTRHSLKTNDLLFG